MTNRCGSPPSATIPRSMGESSASEVVRARYSRTPSTAVGTTTPTTRMMTMPTASITPKSRIIGTSETRITRNAATAAKVAATSGGPRLASVSWMGKRDRSRTTSSSTRLWTWMAKSTPSPIRIGRPEMVTSERSMPTSPRSENVQATAISTARSGSSRHRTRKVMRRTTAMIATAAAPRVSMPPWR